MKLLKYAVVLVSLAGFFSASRAQTIFNPSFEADHYYNGVGYASQNGGSITGWVVSDPTRIGLNLGGTNTPGLLTDNGAIPNGTNVAFIQATTTTNTLSTTISNLMPGLAYRVTFRANSRGAYPSPNVSWSLNGGAFIPFTASPAVGGANPYYTNRGAFVATATTAALALRNGTNVATDATVLLDNFTIAVLPQVTTTADGGAGSLRQMIANATSGDIITFAPALSGATILLSNGEMVLSNSLTVDAASLSRGLTISGGNVSRIFFVNANQTVSLRGLTLAYGNGVGTTLYGAGGAIENLGNLSLVQCTVLNNHASGFSAASLQGSGRGGGVCNDSQNAQLTLVNCTFTGNQAGTYGGGVENRGVMTIQHCTFFANIAESGGGGIDNFGNDYDQGGNYQATMILANSILYGSYSTFGGTQDIRNEAVNITRVGANIAGLVFNSVGTGNSGPNYISANPQLAPLGFYGGPMQTMPPLPGSPAIDSGSIIAGISTDQRGSARVAGTSPDLGAVESGGLWVLNTSDNAANSLRAVLASAASITNSKTILFATNLSGATIPLATQLLITDPYGVTIDASSLPGGIQISGNGVTRVLYVTNNAIATLNSVTLNFGLAPPGSFLNNGGGAGLFCRGRVALQNCSIVNNTVLSTGSASGYAGGIACYTGGDLRLTNCTVAFNQVSGPAGSGGAFYNYGGALILEHCTVAGNAAALYNGGVTESASTSLHATVLANGNTDLKVFTTPAVSLGNNFVADGSSSGLINGVNGDQILTSGTAASANLAPLANYGGSTQTMPPLPGSPVINTGGTSTLTTDQRGYPRSSGLAPDVGAVEGIYHAAGPGKLAAATKLGNGSIQVSLTNLTDAVFPVLANTDFTQPVSAWTPVGFATETSAGTGLMQFIDLQAGQYPQRFYRLKSP